MTLYGYSLDEAFNIYNPIVKTSNRIPRNEKRKGVHRQQHKSGHALARSEEEANKMRNSLKNIPDVQAELNKTQEELSRTKRYLGDTANDLSKIEKRIQNLEIDLDKPLDFDQNEILRPSVFDDMNNVNDMDDVDDVNLESIYDSFKQFELYKSAILNEIDIDIKILKAEIDTMNQTKKDDTSPINYYANVLMNTNKNNLNKSDQLKFVMGHITAELISVKYQTIDQLNFIKDLVNDSNKMVDLTIKIQRLETAAYEITKKHYQKFFEDVLVMTYTNMTNMSRGVNQSRPNAKSGLQLLIETFNTRPDFKPKPLHPDNELHMIKILSNLGNFFKGVFALHIIDELLLKYKLPYKKDIDMYRGMLHRKSVYYNKNEDVPSLSFFKVPQNLSKTELLNDFIINNSAEPGRHLLDSLISVLPLPLYNWRILLPADKQGKLPEWYIPNIDITNKTIMRMANNKKLDSLSSINYNDLNIQLKESYLLLSKRDDLDVKSVIKDLKEIESKIHREFKELDEKYKLLSIEIISRSKNDKVFK
tara:strand:+ start:539 stop:2140 length:1602 start_codon:yes stop_codon:yes gene_type:complete